MRSSFSCAWSMRSLVSSKRVSRSFLRFSAVRKSDSRKEYCWKACLLCSRAASRSEISNLPISICTASSCPRKSASSRCFASKSLAKSFKFFSSSLIRAFKSSAFAVSICMFETASFATALVRCNSSISICSCFIVFCLSVFSC